VCSAISFPPWLCVVPAQTDSEGKYEEGRGSTAWTSPFPSHRARRIEPGPPLTSNAILQQDEEGKEVVKDGRRGRGWRGRLSLSG